MKRPKKSTDKTTEILCNYCGDTIIIWTADLINKTNFCNKKCQQIYQTSLSITTNCVQCQKTIIRKMSEVRKNKSGRYFCDHSCRATYTNLHKKTGCRISKLEQYIKLKLDKKYSTITILYNDKETINSELDIYIPDLRLGVELNGIFHYEPIYGKDKLRQIQNNDHRKFQACLELGIELIIIDTAYIKKFTEIDGNKIFDIIDKIIQTKLSTGE